MNRINRPYLDNLNDAQYKAATTTSGALRIIAGAGSGKTTTLISRCAYMIDEGVSPESILLVTFTNKAAKDMKLKAQRMSKECARINAMTIHSFCLDVLRKHTEEAGIEKKFSVLSTGEICTILKMCRGELKYDSLRYFPSDKTVANLITLAKGAMRPVSEILNDERYIEKVGGYDAEVAILIDTYENYKRDHNYLDYDDMILLTLKILEDPEAFQAIRKKYKHIMVDEYQDTNNAQEAITFKMGEGADSLAIVGDDYQSIYAFRGANVENILEFPQRARNCQTIVLDTNYRSVKEIVDVSNSIMATHANFGVPKIMKSSKGESKKIPKALCFDDEDDESAYVYEEIQKHIKSGSKLSDIAVLERSANMSARLEMLLSKDGIPFEKYGGTKFMERQVVIDILSFLKVMVFSTDSLSWFTVFDLLYNVGPVNAKKLINDIGTDKFLNNPVYFTKSFWGDVQKIKDFVNNNKALTFEDNKVQLLMSRVIGFYTNLRRQKIEKAKLKDESKRTEKFDELKSDLEAATVLADAASSYSTVLSFLDAITLDDVASEPNGDFLTISTIHSAKGLEWKKVYILNVDKAFFHKGPDDESKEQLRLLYVAITRAKDELCICSSLSHFGNKSTPSEYLNNLDCAIDKRGVQTAERHKVYLRVPYEEKEFAKRLGCGWDSVKKLWYVEYKNFPSENQKKAIAMFGVKVPNLVREDRYS